MTDWIYISVHVSASVSVRNAHRAHDRGHGRDNETITSAQRQLVPRVTSAPVETVRRRTGSHDLDRAPERER